MYSALTSEHDVEDTSVKNGNRLDMLHPSRLKAAVMEAGTSLTPASWHGKQNVSQSRMAVPHQFTTDTSDSDAESTFTAPSGRLNSANPIPSASFSSQSRSVFRSSSASNRSPQSSFRRKSFGKASSSLAEDSISLSNRSDSSSHQDHLTDDAKQQTLDRRSSGRLVPSGQQAVPRSAGRTRSPQRVAPAPGPSDGSISSTTGRLAEAEGVDPSSPHLDIFEPRPVLSGGLEAVLGQEAESLGSMSGPELLTHMADGLPTGKTWLRGGESLPSPSCTQGPCKSRSVRKISCMLDADTVSISYNRKGFHGMMQKQATGTEQVVATVFRAQITPGEWHSNKPIMVLTNRGWLALHALSNEAYVMWVLGLNAILGLSQVQQRLYVEKCKVRDIPRSLLLMVQGS